MMTTKTQTTSGHLDLGDGTLYYGTAGEGSTVVLGHAAFLDSRMFDAVWDTLAQHFHVIRYDLRGFGQSSEVQGPVDRRADLTRLLAHLGVTQAHLVGCSMSGEMACDLAIEKPELVASLTMVGSNPSGFEMVGEMPRYFEEMFGAMERGDIDRVNELQIRIWFDGNFREPEQMDAALRQKALEMNRIPVSRKTFFLADMQAVNPLTPPAVTRLNEIKCPTLVIVGSLDHPELVRAADVMVEGIPNARKVVMEGTAHVPSFEKPEEFSRILLEFLQGL
jgi:pimeloyl-ACP methyl ester carboxylesterase